MLIPKNWTKFQHYKDRRPPWIKLYRTLLDDRTFMCLPVASKALAPCLWLLASDDENGHIKGELADIAFKLRMTEDEFLAALKPLISNGMFENASNVLAERLQVAIPERETETETETKRKQRRERKLAIPPDLEPVEGLDPQAWERWFAFRAEIRKPIKPASVAAAQRALAKFGANQAAVVEQSIAQGWQGLFDLKPGATTAANGKPPCPPMMVDGVWNPAHKAWMEKYA